MAQAYSYRWFVEQFEHARYTAENFILSVDEVQFLKKPGKDRWSVAECYSHLIHFGNIYAELIDQGLAAAETTARRLDRPFPPRWHWQKIISYFEPPYKFKMKTINAMQPDDVSKFNRLELLDVYINLQDRFIFQLEKARSNRVDLSSSKVRHPILRFLKMTLAECLAIAEAHQRRHQWQAERTLAAITGFDERT